MNILILGGTGSIGQALTELLKNTAWNVYVTTRTKRENVQNITFLQGNIPILIIHGDRDTQAPLSMAYRLYDSCSSEKQLYVVHGANHAENYRKNPEGYENVIAQFVEEHSGALKKEY